MKEYVCVEESGHCCVKGFELSDDLLYETTSTHVTPDTQLTALVHISHTNSQNTFVLFSPHPYVAASQNFPKWKPI